MEGLSNFPMFTKANKEDQGLLTRVHALKGPGSFLNYKGLVDKYLRLYCHVVFVACT